MKYNRIILVLFAFQFLFLNCEDAIEEDNCGTITGVVIDIIDQSPLAGAIITTNPPSQSIMTNSDGKFTLYEMEIGDYMVTAKKYEYTSSAISIKVKKDRSTNLIIQLEENDGTSSSVSLKNPLPADKLGNIDINPTFQWQPEGTNNKNSLSYHLLVYSTESAQPVIDIEEIPDTFYTAENLEYAKTHFWQIIAKNDDHQVGQSPLWSFRTTAKPSISFLFASKSSSYLIYGAESKDANWQLYTPYTLENYFPRTNPVTQEILFSALHDKQAYLHIMNKDGNNIQRISPLPIVGHHNPGYGFCWSPNGKEVLFCHYDKLYKINKDGSGLFKLATAPNGRHYVFCNWSSISNKIVVQTRGINIYDSEIYQLDANGTNPELIIDNTNGCSEHPSFSHDGKKILYTHDTSGVNAMNGRQLDSRILLYDIETGETSDLSGSNKLNGTNDLQPSFSPNGSKIIFVNTPNTENGQKNIFVMDTYGNNRELYFENAEFPEWH